MSAKNHFSAARSLEVGGKSYRYYSLDALQEGGYGDLSKLPSPLKCCSKQQFVSSTDAQLPKNM